MKGDRAAMRRGRVRRATADTFALDMPKRFTPIATIRPALGALRERLVVSWRRAAPLGVAGWLQRAGGWLQRGVLEPTGHVLGTDLVPMSIRFATGRLFLHDGRLVEAERHLRLGLERRPRDAHALARLSLVFTHVGRLDEAYAIANTAAECDPDSRTANLQLAYVCLKLGRGAEARSAVRTALEAEPGPLAADGADIPAPHIMMLHTGRCGSTVLADLISQHREIAWERELYVPSRRLWHPRANPLELLYDRVLARTSPGRPRYGFEFQVAHSRLIGTDLSAYVDVLPAFGIGYLVALRRENLLRVIVSFEIASRTGQWQRRNGVIRRRRIELAVEGAPGMPGVLERLEELERRSESIASAARMHPHLHLTYEADVANGPHVGYRKICEFVGTEPGDVSMRVHRSNPASLHHLLVNYAGVAAALKPTRFAWMLDA